MTIAQDGPCDKCGRFCHVKVEINGDTYLPTPQICDRCRERMKCDTCGTPFEYEHTYCGSCGTRLTTPWWYWVFVIAPAAVLMLLLVVFAAGTARK
jgi:hypothetical protein